MAGQAHDGCGKRLIPGVTAVTDRAFGRWHHITEMKLRLQGNSLRLRLGRSEVAQLRDTGAVEESVSFKSGRSLVYRVRCCAGAAPLQADFAGGIVTVDISAENARTWASSDDVGLYAQDGGLRIAVEKDFRCLTRPQEEPDAFPHPAEK